MTPDKEKEKQKKFMHQDKLGNYDLDGVSFDGEEVQVAGDDEPCSEYAQSKKKQKKKQKKKKRINKAGFKN